MKQKKQNEQRKPDEELDPILQRLQKLIAIVQDAELASARIRDGDVELEISRISDQSVSITSQTSVPTGAATTPASKDELGDDLICSPMPARFYRSPSPDEPVFVEIGDTVTAGESLATLEVMKTYNDVEAPFNCEILEILVEDGHAVEYNQPLFRVKQL
ncbi:acetyl-CoA carboxylase, biotin carboxyl carrier protein [Candidatus Poribacteria bacterium]|nr:MAG: acetyl-CoA carboxylase, biotin carboxyl carrier protein [Candidatus Poribacteria bacterium]